MMEADLSISLLGQSLRLHKDRVVFWENRNTLLVSDLHLGKAQHFRRAGIPVPARVADVNLDRFQGVLETYQPERILILGDLFHSVYNPVWEQFGAFVHQQDCRFELVPGNHDILDQTQYSRFGIHCHDTTLRETPFLFSHDPYDASTLPEGLYPLCGHLHPGVLLQGKGKQRLKLPCFYFGTDHGILPAFGQFTGLAMLQPSKEDRVFVITPKKVLAV